MNWMRRWLDETYYEGKKNIIKVKGRGISGFEIAGGWERRESERLKIVDDVKTAGWKRIKEQIWNAAVRVTEPPNWQNTIRWWYDDDDDDPFLMIT